MIPGTSGKGKKRRLAVEVYFVLYLSAIILLLGTSPSDKQYDAQLESAIAELIDTDFEVDVQKIALIVPFLPAGMESDSIERLLPRDTMNVIRAHGNFSSVEFRIVAIEDTSTGSSLPAERAYLVRETDSSVTFHWDHNDVSETAIYQVTIEAEAMPTLPEGLNSPEIRSRIQEVVKERGLMRDTAQFTINIIPATSQEYLLAIRNAPMLNSPSSTVDTGVSTLDDILAALASRTPGSGFAVSVPPDILTVPPGGRWRQRVNVLGIPNTTELKVSGRDGLFISSTGSNYIDVTGPAPSSGGEEEISFFINRPNGDRELVRFTVRTGQLDAPFIPGVLYAGETYNLDFTSSGIESSRISVSVTENGRTQDNYPARMTFSPQSTSGVIVFSRYVDGKLYDSKRTDVRPLPDPVIKTPDAGKEKDKVVVEVVAYGTVKGQPNRPVLQILSGNAGDPEEVGTTVDEKNRLTRKKWIVRPKNTSQKFQFTMRAWDLRGSAHNVEQIYAEE